MKHVLFLLLFYCGIVSAQENCDTVRIHFRQGDARLDLSFGENSAALEGIVQRLWEKRGDPALRLERLVYVGGASPEGSVAINRRLSEERARALFGYLARYVSLPDSMTASEFVGRDWEGLLRLAEQDEGVPFRAEALALLQEICREKGDDSLDPLGRLQRLRGGEPYRYMYRELFPALRRSQVEFRYRAVEPLVVHDTLWLRDTVWLHDTVYVEVKTEVPVRPPFYMSLHTNMLYDLALVPNGGVEFYLGRGWSVSGNWMYAWWKSDRKHNYWRIYGGDLAVRKYFGRLAKEKPLTGHHAGVYGGIVTYDFELGGRGYLGDRWSWHAGVEYGYALPIARRLNLDFSLGLGYLGGEYKEYLPIDDCYVWQATKRRRWFGPTKAGIALVWLIGHGNENQGKGGRR